MSLTTESGTIDYEKLYIGGEWASPHTTDVIPVHSATTEERVGSVPEGSPADIDAAVAAARRAFDDPTGWRTWSPEQRGEVLERFAAALEARGAETARRVTIQNGMPIGVAMMFEAGFPALLLRYYSGLVAAHGEERRQGMLGKQSLVLREPLGVVGAIVPWNAPPGHLVPQGRPGARGGQHGRP
ncbi:aldehyde dehydrogenase family protein [Microbacterium aurum]